MNTSITVALQKLQRQLAEEQKTIDGHQIRREVSTELQLILYHAFLASRALRARRLMFAGSTVHRQFKIVLPSSVRAGQGQGPLCGWAQCLEASEKACRSWAILR